MTPERNNHHSTAFLQIFSVMLLITFFWTGWCVDEALSETAPPVRELVIPQ